MSTDSAPVVPFPAACSHDRCREAVTSADVVGYRVPAGTCLHTVYACSTDDPDRVTMVGTVDTRELDARHDGRAVRLVLTQREADIGGPVSKWRLRELFIGPTVEHPTLPVLMWSRRGEQWETAGLTDEQPVPPVIAAWAEDQLRRAREGRAAD